ncbi:hypothetical protein [Leptolyngbya sp. FACHB-261]|uniref:hypothetical protein n=1 Tax=Leptolyngbya sp. FACHB-261 TaxID=2692806 RepID=UPI0016839184|nr:hypothetical protein [Leptolyngbya sp. FACHB-261]MBD2104378.1 hypothetical protein [Leptolyngbya sp. FACHB-261]
MTSDHHWLSSVLMPQRFRALCLLLLSLVLIQSCRPEDPPLSGAEVTPVKLQDADEGQDLANYLINFPHYPGATPYRLGLGPLSGEQVIWSDQTPDDPKQVQQYLLKALVLNGYSVLPVASSEQGVIAAVSRQSVRRYLFVGLQNPTVISLQDLPSLDAQVDRRRFVQEFPKYPRAAEAAKPNSKTGLIWSIASRDSAQMVQEFYQTQLARRGFTLLSRSNSGGSIRFEVSRYRQRYDLLISGNSPTQIVLQEPQTEASMAQ